MEMPAATSQNEQSGSGFSEDRPILDRLLPSNWLTNRRRGSSGGLSSPSYHPSVYYDLGGVNHQEEDLVRRLGNVSIVQSGNATSLIAPLARLESDFDPEVDDEVEKRVIQSPNKIRREMFFKELHLAAESQEAKTGRTRDTNETRPTTGISCDITGSVTIPVTSENVSEKHLGVKLDCRTCIVRYAPRVEPVLVNSNLGLDGPDPEPVQDLLESQKNIEHLLEVNENSNIFEEKLEQEVRHPVVDLGSPDSGIQCDCLTRIRTVPDCLSDDCGWTDSSYNGSLSGLIESSLRPIYGHSHFDCVRSLLVKQSRDILLCRHAGDLISFRKEFLEPATRILRLLKELTRSARSCSSI